jgi:choline dehydrogenase-like flavoprotein
MSQNASEFVWQRRFPSGRAIAENGRVRGWRWDADANLWVCDGSVFPTVGGVNPAWTIQTIAMRTASRIGVLARRGEL